MIIRRFVVLAVVVLFSASLFAQKRASGVVHSMTKRIAPQDSLEVDFPDTPVGQTELCLPCIDHTCLAVQRDDRLRDDERMGRRIV